MHIKNKGGKKVNEGVNVNKGGKEERGMFICIFSLKEKKKKEGGGVCGPAREGWYHTFRPIVTINAGCKTWQSRLNGRLRNGGLHSRTQSAVVALGKLEGKLLFLHLFSGAFS